MDKKTLNNEIILCRRAVRKARVAIVRKIIKKMKILKSCKNEALKEKKLRKSERLYRKIQIIKKLKDDDITKFALRNKDLEKFLKGGTRRERALASLCKHNAVFNKVIAIKENFPNWETELLILLDTMGKKKKKINKKETDNKVEISSKSDKTEESFAKPKTKSNATEKVEKFLTKNIKGNVVKSLVVNKDKMNESEEGYKNLKDLKVSSQNSNDENHKRANGEEKSEGKSSSQDACTPLKLDKIDDPFFIQKKIIIPKLLKEEFDYKTNHNRERKKFQRENDSFIFNSKPYKVKRSQAKPNTFNNFGKFCRVLEDKNRKFSLGKPFKAEAEDEKLHPSWVAKKVQLIKPFEGKKIKFSDD